MAGTDTIRDALFGNPPTPGFKPSREGVLNAFAEVIGSLATVSGGVSTFQTKAAMLAVVPGATDPKVAFVIADATSANNGVYKYPTGGPWALFPEFYNSISAVVQPFVDLARKWASQTSGAVDNANFPGLLSAYAYMMLANHYANDATDVDVPGGAAGERGAKFWSATAAAAVASVAVRFGTIALALAGTSNGRRSTVAMINGQSDDTFLNVAGSLSLLRSDPVATLDATRLAAEKSPLMVTQTPFVPDFSLNPVDGEFYYDGAIIPNRSAAVRPTRDQYQYDAESVLQYAGTYTPNYAADPSGAMRAGRVQMAASGQVFTLFTLTGDALDQRMLLPIKSTPGSGNQTIKIGPGQSGGTNYATTEGAWTYIDAIYVGLSGQLAIQPSGTAIDVIIGQPQLPWNKEIKPEYPTIRATMALIPILNRHARPGRINGPGASFATPLSVPHRINFTSDGSARSVSALTVMLALKKTAASAAQFNSLFQSVGDALRLGDQGQLVGMRCPGLEASPMASNWDMINNDFVILAMRFDATRSSAFVNGVLVATGTGTGGTPLSLTQAIFGGTGFGDTSYFYGFGGILEGYFRWLDDASTQQAIKSVRDRHILWGDTFGQRYINISEGNSITAGAGASIAALAYAQQVVNGQSPKIMRINSAIAGSALGTSTDTNKSAFLYARLPDVVARIKEMVANGIRPIVSIMVGVNAIPATSEYYSYLTALKNAAPGMVKIMVYTITGSSTAAKDAWNAIVLGTVALGYADGAVNLTTNTNLYGPNAAANTTWFPDGLHPADIGHTAIAALGIPVMASLAV